MHANDKQIIWKKKEIVWKEWKGLLEDVPVGKWQIDVFLDKSLIFLDKRIAVVQRRVRKLLVPSDTSTAAGAGRTSTT